MTINSGGIFLLYQLPVDALTQDPILESGDSPTEDELVLISYLYMCQNFLKSDYVYAEHRHKYVFAYRDPNYTYILDQLESAGWVKKVRKRNIELDHDYQSKLKSETRLGQAYRLLANIPSKESKC